MLRNRRGLRWGSSGWGAIVRLVGVVALVAALIGVSVIVWVGHRSEPLSRQARRLEDGTEVFFLSDTRVEQARSYPMPREIRVDGDAFVRVPASVRNLTVRSRLLVLKVDGSSGFRITAYAEEAGEQVAVLYGHVVARKAYASTYAEPDSLAAGEMVMVNRSIDLMEKEKTDLAKLRAWTEAMTPTPPTPLERRHARFGAAVGD